MSPVVAILLFVLLFGGALFYSAWYKGKQLREGKILQRGKDYMEYAEIFTFAPVTTQQLKDALDRLDLKSLGCTISGSTSRAELHHRSGRFSAVLHCQEQTEERTVYRFAFTHWKTSRGSLTDDMAMNMLMTAVEKMFLGLDPSTQVSMVKLNVTTKRSWI